MIGFGTTIVKAIRRAGQEHVNEVTFKHRARPGFNLTQANNFPPSTYRSKVHQIKRPR